MALRNQPYLPLYVNDFSNDLNVKRCSSSSVGVYIMLMCVLHQSHEYGILILRKNEKKHPDQVKNFATLLIKLMPFDIIEIEAALNELLDNEVLKLDGDKLIQKRMVKDGIISDKRSKAGKKGGEKTRDKALFAQAKYQQPKSPEDSPPTGDEHPVIQDAAIEEKKENLINDMASYFKYTLPKHRKQQTLIFGFVHSLPHKGKLDDFIDEFKSYKQLIELRGYPLSFNNFIGEQKEQFENGKWDDNWTDQLNEYNTKPKQKNGTATRTANSESITDLRRASLNIIINSQSKE